MLALALVTVTIMVLAGGYWLYQMLNPATFTRSPYRAGTIQSDIWEELDDVAFRYHKEYLPPQTFLGVARWLGVSEEDVAAVAKACGFIERDIDFTRYV